MFEKEKASFSKSGSAKYAESSRPSCFLYNRNFVTKNWIFSYICWEAKWYQFDEKYDQKARKAKMAKQTKMAKIAKKDRIALFFVDCLSKGVISSICFATLSMKRFLLKFRENLNM